MMQPVPIQPDGPRTGGVLVAQLGARRHYAVPRALHRRHLLENLVTELSADAPAWRWIEKLVSETRRPAALKRLLARRVADVPSRAIRNLPCFALSPLLRRRQGEASPDHWARRNQAFCRSVV